MPLLLDRYNLRPLPLKGGGWEGVASPRRGDDVIDGLKYAIEILPDLRVPKTENAKTARREPCVPTTVGCGPLIETMLVAVELDNDPERRAIKVEDVRTHRMLPPKVLAGHLGRP
jgi:hypothetical protein